MFKRPSLIAHLLACLHDLAVHASSSRAAGVATTLQQTTRAAISHKIAALSLSASHLMQQRWGSHLSQLGHGEASSDMGPAQQLTPCRRRIA
jgi:hypothetical protein